MPDLMTDAAALRTAALDLIAAAAGGHRATAGWSVIVLALCAARVLVAAMHADVLAGRRVGVVLPLTIWTGAGHE